MANSDKNIVITPNTSQSADPQIVFSGADASTGPQNITVRVYPTNSGTLSFEGSAGQLFSVNNATTGTIFSANDVSGIPSIEVLDTGLVKLAQYGGNVLIGTGTDNATARLQVNGAISATSLTASQITSTIVTGTSPFIVTSTTQVNNLNAQYWGGNAFSSFLNQAVRTGDSPTFNTVNASLNGTATTATNWGSYGAVPAAGTSFGNANTIGRSDGNGYTYFNYINSNTGNAENPTVGQVIVTNTTDNFYRKASIAHLTSAVQSNASGSWGINITGNAATATSADQIDSIGFRNTGSAGPINADNLDSNGITYYTSGVTNFSGNATDGALYSQAYSSSWQHQIAGDYRSGQIAVRGKNSGTWQSWKIIATNARVFAQNLILS
jgi:hypothetical protein